LKNSDQLFDAQFEEKMCKATGLDDATVAAIAFAFEPIGQHFRKIIETTPTNFPVGPKMTPKVRLDWLRNDLQPSLDELITTLREPAKLSAKPDSLPSELTEAESLELARLLEKLGRYVDELGDCFQDRIADKSTVNAELRFDLVCRLAEACRNAGVEVSRDLADNKEYQTTTSIILKAACAKICGDSFPLGHHLRDYRTLRRARNPEK